MNVIYNARMLGGTLVAVEIEFVVNKEHVGKGLG